MPIEVVGPIPHSHTNWYYPTVRGSFLTRPHFQPPARNTPIFIDPDAKWLWEQASGVTSPEAQERMERIANKLDRVLEQLNHLQSITGYTFADGVKEGERRVYGRANIPPPPKANSLADLLKTKELQAMLASAPVKKIPRGQSAYDTATGKLKEPKPVKDFGVSLSDDDFKELGL